MIFYCEPSYTSTYNIIILVLAPRDTFRIKSVSFVQLSWKIVPSPNNNNILYYYIERRRILVYYIDYILLLFRRCNGTQHVINIITIIITRWTDNAWKSTFGRTSECDRTKCLVFRTKGVNKMWKNTKNRVRLNGGLAAIMENHPPSRVPLFTLPLTRYL